MMHVLPYRTRANVIDGIIITFTDITLQKSNEEMLQQLSLWLRKYHKFITGAFDACTKSLIILDEAFRIVKANRMFYKNVQCSAEEIIGQSLFVINKKSWDTPSAP